MKRRHPLDSLDADIRDHIERDTEENIARGMAPAEARNAALRNFGSTAFAKENARAVWSPRWLQDARQDLRIALRGLRATPAVSAVAILSLTLAIGSTTGVFSLLHALVLRPLAVPDPYSLVQISARTGPATFSGLSFPAFQALERDDQTIAPLVGFTGIAVLDVETRDGFRRAATMGVTSNFYSAFDVRPAAGRTFRAADFTTEPIYSAVLGYTFWQQAFGGDPSVIGSTVRVDTTPIEIIGVAAKGFTNLNIAIEPALTVALPAFPALLNARAPMRPWTLDPNVTWVTAVGRLRPGVTIEQAAAHLDDTWPPTRASIAPLFANAERRRVFLQTPLTARSLATGWENYGMRSRYGTPLYAVIGIASLVLLIACVNVASLLLSRAAARQHEMAVRVALGASRGRLVRQLLTEGVLLSAVAAAGGVVVAMWAGRLFPALVFANSVVPMAFDAAPDRSVLAFASTLAVATGILFSLAPIWRATRRDAAGGLRHQRRTATETRRMGHALVTIQMALCFVLVTTAGLFVRSLLSIRAVDPGLRASGVVVAYPGPRPGGYQAADNDSYYPALFDRLRAVPGIQSVGVSQDKPLGGQPFLWSVGATGTHDDVMAVYTSASPGFFSTLGIPIVSGRDFAWSDNSRAPDVAIISRSLASRLFGGASAIGRSIHIGPDAELNASQIVGIVADARTFDVKDPNVYAAYIPSLQRGVSANGKALVVRGSVSVRDIDRAVQSLGKEYVANSQTLSGILDASLLQERLTSSVAAFFGALALVLAAIGLYGLMAYAVVQRRREIGIRMALGAQVHRIVRDVLGAGLAVVSAGLAAGFALAWIATRLVGSLLFEVGPHDAATMIAAPLLLLGISLIACVPAAWRAARTDPALVLRNE